MPACGVCNLGKSSCNGDEFICDSYEIPGVDAQTDCDDHIMFVDANFDGEMSDGTQDRPFKALSRASAAAKSRETVAILVGGDESTLYDEILSLQDGVSIVGGWSPEWRVDRARKPTFTPPIPDEGDMFGARIEDIDSSRTLISGVRIVTQDFAQASAGQPGRHNHGVYASNAGKLILRDVFVRAGKGEDGADGADGEWGEDGSDGAPGAWGCGQSGPVCEVLYDSMVLGEAGKPGVAKCDVNNETIGGFGGLGAYSVSGRGLTRTFEVQENGQTSPAGVMGGSITLGEFPDGGNGDSVAGEPVVVAQSGRSGDCRDIMFMSGQWNMPATCHGEAGQGGMNGWGGGGGAGAGHSYGRFMPDQDEMTYTYGPDGGAGGGGGCGGSQGRGGLSGGSSVALLLQATTGIQIEDSSLINAGGGAGGRGGAGGKGGQGGKGGEGGKNVCISYSPDGSGGYMLPCRNSEGAQSTAGNGGNGSNGVDGGHGGGGGGGSSFGVYCVDTLLFNLSSNTFAQGEKGAGGVSEGNSGMEGMQEALVNCE